MNYKNLLNKKDPLDKEILGLVEEGELRIKIVELDELKR